LRPASSARRYVDIAFMGTEDDDAGVRRFLPDFSDEVETAHVRQLQIDKSHVWAQREEAFQPFAAGRSGAH